MKKISFEPLIGILMLLFAIGFNLWLYAQEPTATVDPNDNTFQFALVDRTSQIWDFAIKKCSSNIFSFPVCFPSFLMDHWVPNWAEGYNLPYYYSHIPQILIVTSWRFISLILPISLFTYYHWVIYALLCFFPLSVFLALRIIHVSWIAAGIGALLAAHISTDGLYGLDPPSFLWRGYGLSSQLFAMIWLPLSIAYAHRLFEKKEDPQASRKKTLITALWAIFFLAATTAGHLGIGIIAFLSVGLLSIAAPLLSLLKTTDLTDYSGYRLGLSALVGNVKKLLLMYGGVLILLGYWIIPLLIHGNYHNISFWDPVWKFDSYGAKETIIRLLNGDLFDFGRFPTLTILVLIGVIAALRPAASYVSGFSLLFIFWLLMYFGRTTWGGLIDLIPGMRDFHLSRFIVGVHLAGIFLIPMAFEWLARFTWRIGVQLLDRVSGASKRLGRYDLRMAIHLALVGILAAFLVYPQTIRYSSHNDVLIRQANGNYDAAITDASLLLTTLKELQITKPGRVFAGRGGSWGRNFRIAETPYYMYISTYGIPTVLWLPETWSPNSDTEQYFSEDKAKDYALYNIRYVVTPPAQEVQPFWQLIRENPSWNLYEVDTGGYITTGVRPAIISSDKESFLNVVRLWIQSDYHKQGLYPELTFDKDYPKTTGLPNFKMLDEVTYQVPDGSAYNLFAEVPRYESSVSPIPRISLISQSSDSDMMFRATVKVPENCTECLVILRQTFHPSWRATVDGKPTQPFTVFPFYTAVKMETPGNHEVVFTYKPSGFKITLMVAGLIAAVFLIAATVRIPLIKRLRPTHRE